MPSNSHAIQSVTEARPAQKHPSRRAGRKKRFNIDVALPRIREAVEPFPKAALFELAACRVASPCEMLAACSISFPTRDEVTVPTARRLFAAARTPNEVARLGAVELDRLIRNSTSHEAKARQIHDFACRVAD